LRRVGLIAADIDMCASSRQLSDGWEVITRQLNRRETTVLSCLADVLFSSNAVLGATVDILAYVHSSRRLMT